MSGHNGYPRQPNVIRPHLGEWNPPDRNNHTIHLTQEQLDQIEELAVFHCPENEIAHAIGISQSQLTKLKTRQEAVLQRLTLGRSKGKRILRQVQFQVALQGNVNMLMYLGRVILGQCPEASLSIGSSPNFTVGGTPLNEVGDLSPQAKQHLAELARAITQASISPHQLQAPPIEIEATPTHEIPFENDPPIPPAPLPPKPPPKPLTPEEEAEERQFRILVEDAKKHNEAMSQLNS